MNPQAKSICVASSYTIKASLMTYNGEHNPSIFSNLVNYGGLIFLALAGSADTAERFADVWALHQGRALAIPKILSDQLDYSSAVRQHVVNALTLTRKIRDLREELAFLLAVADEPEQGHYVAAEWGISLVSVGTLVAASTDLLQLETAAPESVASMLAYISRYALTNEFPDVAWVYEHAYEPPMLRLGKMISRSLHSKEFEAAVEILKVALEPAWEYLTPLHVYN